jgi:hypothetical protein
MFGAELVMERRCNRVPGDVVGRQILRHEVSMAPLGEGCCSHDCELTWMVRRVVLCWSWRMIGLLKVQLAELYRCLTRHCGMMGRLVDHEVVREESRVAPVVKETDGDTQAIETLEEHM